MFKKEIFSCYSASVFEYCDYKNPLNNLVKVMKEHVLDPERLASRSLILRELRNVIHEAGVGVREAYICQQLYDVIVTDKDPRKRWWLEHCRLIPTEFTQLGGIAVR